MPLSLFEFHWSEMWRWPTTSPLLAQVELTPLILGVLPPADSLHQVAPKTGNHLLVIVEAGTFVLGVGQEDQVEHLSRTRRSYPKDPRQSANTTRLRVSTILWRKA